MLIERRFGAKIAAEQSSLPRIHDDELCLTGALHGRSATPV
jgi:hypothetical protein